MDTKSIHGMWSSRMAFILAAAGSAVGLGNIWRFPYLTSDNGGGAFVLIYLACILLVGLPIMLAEILIGRQGRMSPINTLLKLAREGGLSAAWSSIGWIGTISLILILSFYSVVGGWTLYYSGLYLLQLFGGDPITDPVATFEGLLGNPRQLLLWHSLFMLMTIGVVAMGVEKGLERMVRFLMPTLLLLLLVLAGYGISTGHFGEAVSFLFKPDFSKVTGSTLLAALGQAFFSLSLGLTCIMAYGAYLPKDISIPRVSVSVVFADTGVALLAGLAIFPIVIAFGLSPEGGGPGLIFVSLPNAFNAMSWGIPYGLAFFVLLAVAAWTSSISMLEPPTAMAVERTELKRRVAAPLLGLGVWFIGLITVFSLNIWSEVRVLGRDLQGAIEYLASDIMLPVGGLLTALFAGWFLSNRISREQLGDMPDWAYILWLWTLRILTPALVLVVLVVKLGEGFQAAA